MVRRRFVWLERDREEETGFGVQKVPAIGVDLRQHRVRFADVGLEHERLARRRLGHGVELLLVSLLLGVAGHDHVGRRERGVRTGERRVAREGRLVELDRTLQVFLTALLPDRATLQVQLVGFNVLSGRTRALRELLVLRCELDAQLADDRTGDLVLHLEDIRELAVVGFRPEMKTGLRVDELRRDPHLVASLANAAFEHGFDTQLAAHLPDVHVAALVGERRGARRDLQTRNARQQVEQLLGHAVAEIVLGGITAQIRERQHGDRPAALARHRTPEPALVQQITQPGHQQHDDRGIRNTKPHLHRRGLVAERRRALDALRTDIEHPRHDHRDREAHHQEDDHERDGPFRQAQRRHHHRGSLGDHPGDGTVANGYFADAAALEFGKKGHGSAAVAFRGSSVPLPGRSAC